MAYQGRVTLVALALLLAACNAVTGVNGLMVAGDGGASAAGGSGGSGAGGQSSTTESTTTTGGTGASHTTTTSLGTTTQTSTDPTQLCVDTINMFRATRGLPPYARWQSEETCVDGEATMDGMMMSAHYDFIHNHPCNSSAEDECPNWSKNPLDPNLGIVGCLTQMWAEKDQPGCAGCDTCDFPYQNCTNCTAEGTTVCGHYLNMKSAVLMEVACGFWSGGWYTQDFK